MLFIVGVGRSGTSLLQSMFSAHSSITYLPETSFFRRYIIGNLLESKYKEEGFDGTLKILEEDHFLSRTGIDPSNVLRSALAQEGFLDLIFYKEMILNLSKESTHLVGDKDPRLIEYLPALTHAPADQVFVINIIRDPRDILASKKKAAWSSRSHPWKHIFANRVQLMLGRNEGPKALGQNYYEVVYEDLIARPKEVLLELCQKLGIPYEESMLSFGDAAKQLVSQEEMGWKKETFGPLLSENKEKWPSELTQREIQLTELCCSEAMQVGRYHANGGSGRRLSLKDQLWVAAGFLIIRAATWPYILYRNLIVASACRKIKGSNSES